MSAPLRKERSAAAPTRGSGLSQRESAPGGEDEFAVGKRKHDVIPNHDREVPDGGCRCRQKTFPDPPHGGGVFAAALEPGLEIVGLAHHFRLLHAKAGRFAPRDPLPLLMTAPMGRASSGSELLTSGR